MGEIICHHEGRYNIYSTISDSFYFEASISLEELTKWVKEEYGNSGLRELDHRLERAHRNGHSGRSMLEGTLEDFVGCNRAGEDEENLSYEECLRRFLSPRCE